MTVKIESLEFHGLEALRLTAASGATAIVTRYGAQVLSWTTPDGKEQLFLSERARFGGGASIRGGVPICFPQFSGMGPLPKHGFVRTMQWTPVAQTVNGNRTMAKLAVTDDAASRAAWPHRFRCELEVSIEDSRLDVALAVSNLGDAAFDFTGALHTYLSVGDVEQVTLHGLTGVAYRDAANGNVIATETASLLGIRGEVDRVFHDASQPVTLAEGPRKLVIGNEGFADAVVWNPGEKLCATLTDMAPDGFRRMLCVEAAAVRVPVRVEPGQNWLGRQRLACFS